MLPTLDQPITGRGNSLRTVRSASSVSLSLAVKIYQMKLSAIVDSGCVFNCIDSKLVKRLNLTVKPFENDELGIARSVTGEIINCNGMCEVPLKFSGIICVTPMRVMENMTDNILLGTPFLIDNEVMMDFDDSYLFFKNFDLVVPLQRSIDETVARITRNCVLKAQAHNIVPVTISQNIQCQLCQKSCKDRQLIVQPFE